MWFNRLYPDAIYVDIRPKVRPTVVADTAQLPFKDASFDLVVFDPPHVTHGKNSAMALQYGNMEAEEIKALVLQSSNEAYRVTIDEALMALKWNDHDVKLDRILKLMEGWEPLFGQRVSLSTKHRSITYWVMLKKRPPGYHTFKEAQRFLFEVEA